MSGEMRIGAKLPDFGPLTKATSLRECAARGEAAGFDSLWVSDHIVMPTASSSTYPFSPGGAMNWDPAEPWYDALISMATAAAVTHRAEIGAAVLIAALRNPLVLAKQLATLDVLSGGRVALGVGVGWLREEFEALGVPFESRGRRLDEWIEILRDCWTGAPAARDSGHHPIPEGILCHPVPAHVVPVLVGGVSPAAFRRVARHGDGWVGFMAADRVDVGQVRRARRGIDEAAAEIGRPPPERLIVRVPGSAAGLAPHLGALAEAGARDVIVNVPWLDDDGPEKTLEILRSATG